MRQDIYSLREKLHTEALEEKYGKISLRVLYDDDMTREVLLIDEQDIARTYAITMKCGDWRNSKEICTVNNAILTGESIGQAFRKRGFHIVKNAMATYKVEMPEWLRNAFRVEEQFAKSRITEFLVGKSGRVYRYGFVTEVYSPDFLKP